MSEELILHQGELATILEAGGLSQALKPLVNEIHLFDTYVAGTTHIPDKSILETVKEGDKFSLQREENKFDQNAIMMLTNEKKKIGYVPEKDNVIFARLMDAGKLLTANVTKISRHGSFFEISVGIFLTDY